MKILLSTIASITEPYIQLGIHNIKAYIDSNLPLRKKVQVKINVAKPIPRRFLSKEQDAFDLDKSVANKLINYLLKEKADVVGFSCFVWNVEVLLYVAQKIKKLRPKTIIVFGGPEVSHRAYELTKKKNYIDFIIKNDGEESFYELIVCLLNNVDPTNVKGLCYKSRNNEIIDNPNIPSHLDKFPSPYTTNLIDLTNKDTQAIIETMRGCPYRCAYCSYYLANPKINLFPIRKVYKEIKYVLKNRTQKIAITDDNFNLNEVRAKKILRVIIKHNKGTKYIMAFLNAYVLKMSEEFVDLLKKADIYGSIGVQTHNKKTLSNIKRYSEFNTLESNLLLLKQRGVRFNLSFIVGLPGDSYEDMKMSVDWAYSFSPQYIVMQELQLYHGTGLYKNAKQLGIRFRHNPPYKIIDSKTFTKKDIKKSMKLAYAVSMFYKKKYLFQTINLLVNKYKLKFSYVIEEWLKAFKYIINNEEYLYRQNMKFLHFLLRTKTNIDWIELDNKVKADVHGYLKHTGNNAFVTRP